MKNAQRIATGGVYSMRTTTKVPTAPGMGNAYLINVLFYGANELKHNHSPDWEALWET